MNLKELFQSEKRYNKLSNKLQKIKNRNELTTDINVLAFSMLISAVLSLIINFSSLILIFSMSITIIFVMLFTVLFFKKEKYPKSYKLMIYGNKKSEKLIKKNEDILSKYLKKTQNKFVISNLFYIELKNYLMNATKEEILSNENDIKKYLIKNKNDTQIKVLKEIIQEKIDGKTIKEKEIDDIFQKRKQIKINNIIQNI